MRRLLTAGASALALFSLSSCSGPAYAQGQAIGATVDSSGNCPAGTVVAVGNGRYLYETAKGALCVNGTFSAAATAPYAATPKGYQQVSVTTAAGFTPPAGATYCYISTETQAIRYRTDGSNPTTTVGALLPVSSSSTVTQLLLSIGTLTAFKMIAVAGTATVNVDCYS